MKSVIITGAGKGIGRAIARACAAEGYTVHACDKDAALLQDLGSGVQGHVLDVSDFSAVEQFFQKFDDKNRPAALVNNAGIYPARNILDYTPGQMEGVFGVNVLGAMYCTQLFARPLVEGKREGVIVNLASVAQYGSADAVYGASKGAVAALTRCCALSLSPYIRVNAIAPGIVRTDMFKDVPEPILEWYRETELVKEPIEAEDIADTALFLLSEKARHYTGATFDLNNGFHRR